MRSRSLCKAFDDGTRCGVVSNPREPCMSISSTWSMPALLSRTAIKSADICAITTPHCLEFLSFCRSQKTRILEDGLLAHGTDRQQGSIAVNDAGAMCAVGNSVQRADDGGD